MKEIIDTFNGRYYERYRDAVSMTLLRAGDTYTIVLKCANKVETLSDLSLSDALMKWSRNKRWWS